jgi:hypothetical protein
MITEEHYTTQNDHPEDRIFRDKEYINRLQNHIDEVYEKLSLDLRLNDEGKNFLFDYLYNEDRDIDFEDYLNNLGYRYDEVAFKKRKSKYINL